ncbi:MAG: hypothetical protein AAGF94_00730 [Pseudomonadota bacterium]
MKAQITTTAFTILWIVAGMLLVAPFLLAGLALAYGELGLGAVLFGLGLLQAAVLSSVAFARMRESATRKLTLETTI